MVLVASRYPRAALSTLRTSAVRLLPCYLAGACHIEIGAVRKARATSPHDIEITDGTFHVDAAVIAVGLDIETDRVLDLLRSGEITSRSEQGVGVDAGFHRLTFYHRNRRFRVIIDEAGRIIRQSTVNFGALGRLR